MKAMNHFVVELEKRFHDTITTDSGIKFHIDPKWNEFENRVVEGLYFHHLVVLQDGQRLGAGENDYLVLYDPNTCVSNQAIAYKDQDTGEVHPLGDWCLMSPVEQEEELASEVLEIVSLKTPPPKTAQLWKGNVATMDLGLTEGDIVGIKRNMDYSLMIDGKEKYRVDPEDLLYVYND
jgi:hypothetical protein